MKRWGRLKAFLYFLLPSMGLGLLLGAYPGFITYKYVWEDADFCLSCHVHDYVNIAWKNSVHGQLTTCHDCHHLPLHEYIREAYVQVTEWPKFPDDLDHVPHVPKDLCQACHLAAEADRSTITGPLAKEEIDKLPKVDHTYLHQIHLKAKTKVIPYADYHLSKKQRDPRNVIDLPMEEGEERSITCTDCHGGPGNRAHNFRANDSNCVRCHQEVHQSEIGKKYGCRSCHFQGFMMPDTKNFKESSN